jgi:predicted alpha/beta superfamily hydrolase
MWVRFLTTVMLLCSLELFAQTPIVIGHQYTLKSSVLDEDRRVSVYLPRSYVRSDNQTYDVLYMLDGRSNLLNAAGIQQFLAGYRQMPELIIVGIHNTVRDRDFTPSEVKETPNSGGAVQFRTFIQKELFPFMEKTFRAGDKRYLSGHSFGGLFAIDTLVNTPSMFDAYFTFSPSLRWDDDLVLKKLIDKLETGSLTTYLYVNIGDEGIKLRRPILELHEALKSNRQDSLRWKVDWLNDENHSTTPVIGQFLAFRDYFSVQ